MRRLVIGVLIGAVACSGSGNPNAPSAGPLGDGQWGEGGACVTISATCTFVSGCAQGQFPRPTLRDDGTFDVDGTYVIHIGPVTYPAPSAHYSGSVVGTKMVITVTPGGGTLPKATYTLKPDSSATCGETRCV